ncbi:zf-HC2 domain-containing protein [Streptomyces sp. G-G2]|uniref:zf-HC2 domain-containing protein n=1 Tax=Streptomyces sp. G-G2 TaxID=3046201 RepID=UPI0024BA2FE1|nr:zf-HC2 domain-containing protein [Streptomyces sp. G-G2]MDJ0384438.1 zf-HC2 domain-containing protein [Streptomyces sp. G-G2]
MSGVSPSAAEHHLGDRLAALVDGELSHDGRERVLAHLATCAKCKSEADAQRRLKTLFVESAPPPLSAGLLARLQGLPGAGPEGPPGPPRPAAATDPFATFGYAFQSPRPQEGFRIHEVGRPRRRFAFVAAGAVSLAAIALGGSLPMDSIEPNARGEGGASVTPAVQPGASGGALSVVDAVIRDRPRPPVGTVTLGPELAAVLGPSASVAAPLPPVAPSLSPRPVSLTR